MEKDQIKNLSVCILGDGGVGKSSITLQYVSGLFKENYDPTIGDSYYKKEKIGDYIYNIRVEDTAGQEEFKSILPGIIKECDAFVFVYSITDSRSLVQLENLHKLVTRTKDNFDAILVGNKKDLERAVRTSEGQALAQKIGCPFIEISAKEKDDVEKVFHTLIESLTGKSKEVEKPTTKKKKKSGFFSCFIPSEE